jgi:hypothetical protein
MVTEDINEADSGPDNWEGLCLFGGLGTPLLVGKIAPLSVMDLRLLSIIGGGRLFPTCDCDGRLPLCG